jgi:hypothetical protein
MVIIKTESNSYVEIVVEGRKALPIMEWLIFEINSVTFSGIPIEIGNYTIRVSACDAFSPPVYLEFELKIFSY